jgi:thiopurine S-methyltransferase
MEGPPFAVSADEVSALYQEGFSVEQLAHTDILEEQPRFKEEGLNAMRESVYRLRRR